MTFQAALSSIEYVKVDDDKISMFQNNQCLMITSKSALSAMIMAYENILIDLEKQSSNVKMFYSDENTVIYTKKVVGIKEILNHKQIGECKVLCIVHAPSEIVLKMDDFQLMLISAAIACRITADDKFRSKIGSQYMLNDTQLIIFHDSQRFSIVDESCEEQFALPIIALATLIKLKKIILDNIRSKNYFVECTYWSNEHFEISGKNQNKVRMITFTADYKRGNPVYIRINNESFEKMVHIATSGPSWTDDMDHTMEKVRDSFWKGIPINTVKSIDFSKDGKEFTLINEVNGDTLTLPISALKAAERKKREISSDLGDYSFMPTYEKDWINEYWTDGNYAIRTGAFINLCRDIDCNVVRFVRLRDNYYKFVVQKKAFLNLLDELKNLEYY